MALDVDLLAIGKSRLELLGQDSSGSKPANQLQPSLAQLVESALIESDLRGDVPEPGSRHACGEILHAHLTFSVNRLGRFRESEILRHIFERVVAACMLAGLVKSEGFAVDASVMEANASRYHGKSPTELDWTDVQRQKRAVAEYLAGLEAEAQDQKG